MNKGFSIIELVMAAAVILLVGTALLGEIFYGQKNTFNFGALNRANALAQEGIEIIKNIRDDNFFDLKTNVRGLNFSTSTANWQLVNDPETIDGIFRREVKITDIDAYHKEAVVKVYAINATSTINVQLVTRFANWFNSIEDWSQLNSDGSFDLTPENSGANNHNAEAIVAKDNYLYIGNANSNGKEFVVLDLTDAPNLVMEGSTDLDGSPEDLVVLGNYAYLASSSNTEELQVIKIANPSSPILAVSFNLTSANSGNENNDTTAIDVAGNTLALGRINSSGQELFIFDISNPMTSGLVGKLDLNGNPKDLKIINNKVFIVTDDNDQELQVVDIINNSQPSLIATFDLDSGDKKTDGLSLDVGANRLYLGREGSTSAPEFYIFNIANPSQPSLLSTLNLGSNAEIVHISLSEDVSKAFILTNDPDAFQVINITNDLQPSLLASLSLSGSPNQADYSSVVQKIFVVGHANPEIQIISPALLSQPN